MNAARGGWHYSSCIPRGVGVPDEPPSRKCAPVEPRDARSHAFEERLRDADAMAVRAVELEPGAAKKLRRQQ